MEIHEPTIDLKYQKFKTKEGKTCPAYIADTNMSKQLSRYTQIMDDLRSAITLVEELGEHVSAEVEKAIWTSAVMLYGKCFASAEGRRIKLEESHILKFDVEAIMYHRDLLILRNKFIAHAGGTSMENSESIVVLSPEDEGKSIRYIAHTTVSKARLDKSEREKFIAHAFGLFQVVQNKVEEIHPLVLKEHAAMDINFLYENSINA